VELRAFGRGNPLDAKRRHRDRLEELSETVGWSLGISIAKQWIEEIARNEASAIKQERLF